MVHIKRSLKRFHYVCVCIYTHTHTHTLYIFIHSSVGGHLGCFHVLGIVNSAAMNTGVHVSFQTMFFPGYMPRSGTAGSYGSSVFTVLRSCQLLCIRNLW